MPPVATVVPEEADLLCEGCGYTLKGLPPASNCPECGRPIAQSVGEHRSRSSFEQQPGLMTYLKTTLEVIFKPGFFFGHLKTRIKSHDALKFSRLHRMNATVLFGAAGWGHLQWALSSLSHHHPGMFAAAALISLPLIYCVLAGLTWLTAWLSAVEARYWGMRLPYAVVVRGLQFHSAAYLPVGILGFVIVWTYRLLLASDVLNRGYDMMYLYTLCAAVIVSAIYLFQVYWIAMRSMRYANR